LLGDIGAQDGLLDPLGRALSFQVAHYKGFGAAELVVIFAGGPLLDAVIFLLRNDGLILENPPLAVLQHGDRFAGQFVGDCISGGEFTRACIK